MWSKILFHEQKRQNHLPNLFSWICSRRFKCPNGSNPAPKPEPKKKDDIENIDDTPDDTAEDDVISLDDQKEIEESNEEFKPD